MQSIKHWLHLLPINISGNVLRVTSYRQHDISLESFFELSFFECFLKSARTTETNDLWFFHLLTPLIFSSFDSPFARAIITIATTTQIYRRLCFFVVAKIILVYT